MTFDYNDLTLNEYKIIPIKDSVISKQIDDATYFSSEYKDYISNSRLGLLEDGDLILFLKGLVSKSTSSLAIGTAVHAMILEPESYEISSQLIPSGKAAEVVKIVFDYRCKGYKIIDSLIYASETVPYYKDQLTKTRIKTLIKSGLDYYKYLYKIKSSNLKFDKIQLLLDKRGKETAESCINSILSNNGALQLLRPDAYNINFNDLIVRNEDAIIMDLKVKFPNSLTNALADEVEQDLKIKIKIDNWSINFDKKIIMMNDLKTTGKPIYLFPGSTCNETGEFISGSFQHYRYYRQMAFYIWVLRLYLQKTYNINLSEYKTYINMIVVSTIPEYNSGVYQVTNNWIDTGFKEFTKFLRLAAYALYNKEQLLADEYDRSI